MAIIADGGIGKSALTDKWITDLKKSHYDGIQRVFAWSFYSQGSHQHTFTSSQEFFASALPFFGFAGELPKNDDDKARELAKCLQNQAGLLLLDGLEPLQQPPHIGGDMADVGMREFLVQLHHHRHPHSFVLISSRQEIIELDGRDDYLPLPLETLREDDGAALLQALDVKGTREECQAVSRDLHGHALSLVLLASLLKLHKRGDIRYVKELPPLDSDSKHNGHAKRVLSYYDSLLSDNERRFMHCLALFDRPMHWKEKAALFENAEHAAPLAALPDEEWQDLQTALEIKGLLLKNAASDLPGFKNLEGLNNHHRTQWDTHPLIRQFFAQQFKTQQPLVLKQAHRVLFEYFQSFPDKPEPNITDLEPLYRAVVHGCLAGEYQAALVDVYQERIRHGNEAYSIQKLGAYSQDLIALSAFFPQGWLQPVNTGLTEDDQAWLLAAASFCLMSLGRLAEAVAPYEATTKLMAKLEDWKQAAISAGNLTNLLLSLGKLAEAETAARQAIDYALKTDNKFQQMVSYSQLATVLHRCGQLQAAQQNFALAEQLEQERGYSYLFSQRGAQYCALLLDIASNSKDLEQVLERGKYGLSVQTTTPLLDNAFNHLILARTYQALQQPETARTEFDLAIQSIQKAGFIMVMPEFYLARAAFYLEQNEPENAAADLKTAQHTIARCGMKLYAVDYALLQARYYLALNQPQHAKPFYEQAEMLISETGYHLRDKALAEIKSRL